MAGQQTGFRLVVVHRDGTDGITYNLLGDQIDIGRTEGDLLFEDPHLAPRHARIVASLTGRVLTPLETRNGVYVRLRGPVDLQDGDYTTVAGLVLARLGHIPTAPGETVDLGRYTAEVVEVTGHAITRVRLLPDREPDRRGGDETTQPGG